MFAGYIIYAIVVSDILDIAGLSFTVSDPVAETLTLDSLFALIFLMMGEELFKFVPLMLLMRIIYKYSDNRKLSIIESALIVMICFGLLHWNPPYSTLVSALFLQGFGTVFEMYGYIKTKNLFVPYLSHFFTDFIIKVVILLGFVS